MVILRILKGKAKMETFDYEDVQLIPNKCILKSRKEADTRIKFGPGRSSYQSFRQTWQV